jgi:hypothetical protein
MQMSSAVADPIHVALKFLAVGCIEEMLVDDAEALVAFLEPLNVAPRGVSLVHVWSLSERHRMREALRRCLEQTEKMPEAEEFQPLLGLLLFFNNEPGWQAVCERVMDSPTAPADGKRLAASLLDGSFGKKKPEAEEKAAALAASDAAAAVEAHAAVDYAAFGAYMRA